MNQNKSYDVIIIGAGISGLAAGIKLLNSGKKILVIEKSIELGGKINSKLIDGFRIDNGFQVLLTGYSETSKLLNMNKLDLSYFDTGALIWNGRKFNTISDPTRNISELKRSILSPIGNIEDKLRTLLLKLKLLNKSKEKIFSDKEITTKNYFIQKKYSKKFREIFLEPFFSGILLDAELQTSSRFTEYIFKILSISRIAVPKNGIGSITKQLADQIPKNNIMVNSTVEHILDGEIVLKNGVKIKFDHLICATDSKSMIKLFPKEKKVVKEYTSCTTHYFSSNNKINSLGKHADTKKIILNGSNTGFINNIAILSNIAKEYAPNNKTLLAITEIQSEHNKISILNELQNWFPSDYKNFKYIESIHIKNALPKMKTISNKKIYINKESIIFCGDYLSHPSIEGAVSSGIEAANQLLE